MIPCNFLSSSSSLSCRNLSLLLRSNPSPNPTAVPFSSPLPPLISAPRFLCHCWRRGSSSDSNAESVRRRKFRFRDESGGGDFTKGRRRWWTECNSEDGLDDEFEPIDDDDDGEQLWEKVWIFKVFKSYGYLFPAILASMLLATGPKAFLMALALPLGQSAISLAIDKLWGPHQEERNYRHRVRRKPFSRTSEFRKQEQDETSHEYTRKDDGETAGTESRTFGGWDELDQQRAHTRWQPTGPEGSSQPSQVKMGKFSMKPRYRDAPLFLRLLIAVFPFMGSWIRLL